MASLRKKGIQNSRVQTKSENLSPDIRVSRSFIPKPLDSGKYTPVLTRKSVSARVPQQKTAQKSREVSFKETSLNSSTLIAMSSTSTQFLTKKKPKEVLSNSNSLGTFKTQRSIFEKKPAIPSKKSAVKSPRKQFKAELSRETIQIKECKLKTVPEKVWRKVLNLSNGIEPHAGSFTSYTVYIGKGNNHPLIKRVLLSRPWWKIVENKENANFVWTQWRDKQVLTELKCFNGKSTPKEELGTALACQVATKNTPKSELDSQGLNLIQHSKSYLVLNNEKINSDQQRLHNKLEFNYCLTNKKGLFQTMKDFYPSSQELFSKLPITYNISSDQDPEFVDFLNSFQQNEEKKLKDPSFKNIWIVKPGEFTNRGTGITVCKSLDEILNIIKPVPDKTYIVQKYIENPLLINKRKFDIRCYVMMTSINGVIQGYFYLDGYLRTTSQEFSLDQVDPFVHLTNDAIQKHSSEYGKFENGNKLSYRDFQRYLDTNHKEFNFFTQVLPKIRDIVKDTMQASFNIIDKNKRMHCMEIFGYDFMIDEEFKPWLIEINTNPCLELASPYLRILIPAMVENAFRLVIDSLFPVPRRQHQEVTSLNRFELIFHSESYGKNLAVKMESE